MHCQRKRIWIHPFQTGLFIRIALYCLLYQVIAWAFFGGLEQINAGFAAMGTESPFSGVLVRILLTLLVLVPPLAVDATRFAHRLVGPLYRFRKTLQAIAAGEPVALVQLRKGDLLVDFQDDFNAMLNSLQQQGLVVLQGTAAPVDTETPPAAGNLLPPVARPGS